jgi:16S rRNA (uracil1498-N3)-methyltransferase
MMHACFWNQVFYQTGSVRFKITHLSIEPPIEHPAFLRRFQHWYPAMAPHTFTNPTRPTGTFMMPRFFHAEALAVGAILTLPEALTHHILVLRLALGAPLTLFNGDGGQYTATLTSIEKKRVSVEVKAYEPIDVELPFAITLAQALPESSKMDWIIEKAVELGVSGIAPLAAQRCVVRLSGERAIKRHAHWQGVIVSASEQCGRNRLAQLAQLSDYAQWITQQDLHRRIILTPRAESSLANWTRHQPPQAITLVIGPEGGLSPSEEKAAIDNGALALSLGPRILRTETAGLAALAIISGAWGGM